MQTFLLMTFEIWLYLTSRNYRYQQFLLILLHMLYGILESLFRMSSIGSTILWIPIQARSEFQELIRPSVERKSRTYFLLMIYAITLTYTQKYTPNRQCQRVFEFNQIGSIARHEFLEVLDKKLKPQSWRIALKMIFMSCFSWPWVLFLQPGILSQMTIVFGETG